jgi:hypothetical protein
VKGYSANNYTSACLKIGKNVGGEQLKVVNRRPEPWSNLELPDGHKEIIQSLIESHFSEDKSRVQFDLVRGKGKFISSAFQTELIGN